MHAAPCMSVCRAVLLHLGVEPQAHGRGKSLNSFEFRQACTADDHPSKRSSFRQSLVELILAFVLPKAAKIELEDLVVPAWTSPDLNSILFKSERPLRANF